MSIIDSAKEKTHLVMDEWRMKQMKTIMTLRDEETHAKYRGNQQMSSEASKLLAY